MSLPRSAPPAFFSYSREDSAFALRLAGDLKAAGADVWLDQLDIKPGQRWDRAVEEALGQCVRMLVVLTPAAVDSTNVMDEVSFALEERKTIIPIVHRDCAIPFRLRRLQHLDFRQDYTRALNELVRTLVSGPDAGLAGSATPVSPEREPPISRNEPQPAIEPVPAARPLSATPDPLTNTTRLQPELTRHTPEHVPAPQPTADRRNYGAATIGVIDDVREPRPVDAVAVWPLVDRFGGVCLLIVAVMLPVLLGVGRSFASSEWTARFFGMLCPAVAAIVPAFSVNRPGLKYVPAGFGVASLLAPIVALFTMRGAMEATGSASIGAVAAGLTDLLVTLPFVIAALFAVGATLLPTSPASLHARTRVALAAASALLVLLVAKTISDSFATASPAGVNDLPWLAAWLVRIAAPKGIPGLD